MESRSGSVATAAPATQKGAGTPGRQNAVPIARPATACESAEAIRCDYRRAGAGAATAAAPRAAHPDRALRSAAASRSTAYWRVPDWSTTGSSLADGTRRRTSIGSRAVDVRLRVPSASDEPVVLQSGTRQYAVDLDAAALRRARSGCAALGAAAVAAPAPARR